MNSLQLIKELKLCLKSNVVPFIQGSPGIGKSDIVRTIANNAKLQVIDVRLSQCDPSDLLGFPKLSGTKAEYLPMAMFPIEGDLVPEGYNGWLLFLDELNSAPKSIQAASYKIILDRMVGNHRLHPNCFIVSAGNLETDNAVVNPMSTALKSRLVSLTLDVDSEAWLSWAEDVIDFRILSFIRYQRDALHDFNPEKTDCSYACPRSWHILSKILSNMKDDLSEHSELVVGTIGNIGYTFIDFCKNINNLPSMTQIMSGVADSNLDLGTKYLVVGSILNNAKEIDTVEHGKNVAEYLDKIGRDFSVIFYKGCFKKNPKLMSNSAISSKIKEYASWLQM